MAAASSGRPGGQRLADRAGRELHVVGGGHAGNDGDAEAQALAIAAQALGIAAAPRAEGDVEPDRHVPGAQALVQHTLGEGLVRHGGQLGVEGEHVQALHPRSPGAGLLVQRHQPEGRRLRLEPAAGVGLEGDHAQRRVQRGRRTRRARDHLLMPPVHPVEVAERQRAARKDGSRSRQPVDQAQRHLSRGPPGNHDQRLALDHRLAPDQAGGAQRRAPLASSSDSTSTRVVTVSPSFTGRRKLSVWPR
jgi:hypothetical protein